MISWVILRYHTSKVGEILGNYTTPQQNKTGNLHLLILEE